LRYGLKARSQIRYCECDATDVLSTTISRGGYVLNALHEPLVMGPLVASPVLSILADLFLKWVRQMDEPAGQNPAALAGEAEGTKDDRGLSQIVREPAPASPIAYKRGVTVTNR
jgi:hypothetical protein